jgi:hypothetical protein
MILCMMRSVDEIKGSDWQNLMPSNYFVTFFDRNV